MLRDIEKQRFQSSLFVIAVAGQPQINGTANRAYNNVVARNPLNSTNTA